MSCLSGRLAPPAHHCPRGLFLISSTVLVSSQVTDHPVRSQKLLCSGPRASCSPTALTLVRGSPRGGNSRPVPRLKRR